MVPDETINGLLRTMGVEPGEGVNLSLSKEGFEGVRKAVKRVGREGWSAGQILEQVCLPHQGESRAQVGIRSTTRSSRYLPFRPSRNHSLRSL